MARVWATDITYAQIGGRHMYLTAVIDWHSRHMDDYNSARPHQSLGYETPSSWYFSGMAEAA